MMALRICLSLEQLRPHIEEALESAMDWKSGRLPVVEDIKRLAQTVINRANRELPMAGSRLDVEISLTNIVKEVAYHYQQAQQPRVRVVGTGEAQNTDWWGE